MKSFSILIVLLMAAFSPVASMAALVPGTFTPSLFAEIRPDAPQDTIIINMPNQAKITVVVKNTDELGTLREYNLDSLMVMLSKYAKQVEEAARNSEAKQITLDFYPARDSKQQNAPEKVSITMSTTTRSAGAARPGDHNKLEILIARALKIDVDYDETRARTTIRVDRQSDSTQVRAQQKKEEKQKSRSLKLSWDVDLGLNTFVDPEPNPVPYDLRPLGSRYVSINTHVEPRIGGPSSPLHLRSGLELAFNNFMFDKNVTLVESDNQTLFVVEQERNFHKSKLAMSSINLPLMATLKVKNSRGKQAFSIGAGGFVGHRLGSHTKVKYPDGGRSNKDKERSNFNLSDVQYGTNFLLGFGPLQLFAKYNMNPLFRDNRGPDVNVLSFGVTFFDR